MSQIHSNIEDSQEPYEYLFVPLTWMVKVYSRARGESASGVTPFTTGLLATNMGMGWVRLHFVLGELNDKMNRDIIKQCRVLGFHRIYFETVATEPATRWAEFVEERDGLKRWVIDLEKPLKERKGS